MSSYEKFIEGSRAAAAWLRDYVTAIKNGRVHPFTPIERKAREATRNEPWGPTGTQLGELVSLAEQSDNCLIIFAVLENRLSYPPPKWRNVYKALVVLEFLVKRGSEQCLQLGTDATMIQRIKSLGSFEFTDPADNRDYGINVRKKSETLSILLEDLPMLQQERAAQQAKAKQYAGYTRQDMSDAGSFKIAPTTGWGLTRSGSDVGEDGQPMDGSGRVKSPVSRESSSQSLAVQRNAGEMKGVTLEDNKKNLELLKKLLDRPENKNCADCRGGNAGSKPSWASINCGVFICMKCAGYHRGLGVHVSQVRSCTLDTWLPQQLDFMARTGNAVANAYWEARIGDTVKPANSDPHLEHFIRHKYINKAYADTEGQWPPPESAAEAAEQPASPSKSTGIAARAAAAAAASPVAAMQEEPPALINLMDFDDYVEAPVAQEPPGAPAGPSESSNTVALALQELSSVAVPSADPWGRPAEFAQLSSMPTMPPQPSPWEELPTRHSVALSQQANTWDQIPTRTSVISPQNPWDEIPTNRSIHPGALNGLRNAYPAHPPVAPVPFERLAPPVTATPPRPAHPAGMMQGASVSGSLPPLHHSQSPALPPRPPTASQQPPVQPHPHADPWSVSQPSNTNISMRFSVNMDAGALAAALGPMGPPVEPCGMSHSGSQGSGFTSQQAGSTGMLSNTASVAAAVPAQVAAAPIDTGSKKLLDQLQWKGLELFVNDANKSAKPAAGPSNLLGRPTPPAPMSLRDQKRASMQQHAPVGAPLVPSAW